MNKKEHLPLFVVASTSKVDHVLKIVVARWRSIWRPFSAQKKTSKFELIHEAVTCIEFEFTYHMPLSEYENWIFHFAVDYFPITDLSVEDVLEWKLKGSLVFYNYQRTESLPRLILILIS